MSGGEGWRHSTLIDHRCLQVYETRPSQSCLGYNIPIPSHPQGEVKDAQCYAKCSSGPNLSKFLSLGSALIPSVDDYCFEAYFLFSEGAFSNSFSF